MKLKCIDIEVAVMQYFGIRQNIIVPNISWGAGLHECDLLIITKSRCVIEVEIKVSKADLLKDTTKGHGHNSDRIRQLYFAVPSELYDVALSAIPERAGIICITKQDGRYSSSIRKAAAVNPKFTKWAEKDVLNVARLGCMRILSLKQKVIKLSQ